MSSNFYKINKGINLTPQPGPADPAGKDGDIYYNDALAKFRKFQGGVWTDLDTSGSGGNSLWIAQQYNISAGSTSVTVPISQNDTSYIVLAQIVNTVDPTPQFQPIISISKTTSNFTVSWSVPTDSVNYKLAYIVPMKAFVTKETAIGSGVDSITETLLLPQNGANYGLIAQLQNTVDVSPLYQTTLITAKTASNFTASWNFLTDSANYVLSYMIAPTVCQKAISNGATSVTAPLPVNYGSTAYAVVAMMHNVSDPTPQFQPIVVTSKNNGDFVASWSDPADSANYILTYYAISYS